MDKMLINKIEELEEMLMRIEGRIQRSITYSNYWVNYATSKANHARILIRDGKQLTIEELEEDAFSIASSFIQNIEELTESKIKYVKNIKELKTYL